MSVLNGTGNSLSEHHDEDAKAHDDNERGPPADGNDNVVGIPRATSPLRGHKAMAQGFGR